MKKFIVVLLIGAVVLGGLAFAGVAFVNAQAPTPETPYGGRYGGMMGGAGMGVMHDAMQAALAERLGMSVEELAALRAEGKTVYAIAQDQGMTDDEIRVLMSEARSAALAQLVEDGVLTQEQADWMSARGGRMMGGNGAGNCPMFDGDETGSGFQGRGRMGGGMMRGWGPNN